MVATRMRRPEPHTTDGFITAILATSLVAFGALTLRPASAEPWIPNGSLGIVRSAPKAGTYNEPRARMRPPEMPKVEARPTIIIDTAKHTLTVNRESSTEIVAKTNGTYALKKGTYSVALKQTDPLWYAPPTYFLRRGMKVPAEGSSSRYMRGALGHKAIFFDDKVAIHSGPIWNEEIGGIKISNEDMAKLFNAVEVGSQVQIR